MSRRKLPAPRPRDRHFGDHPAAGRDLPYTLDGGHPLHAPYLFIPPGTPMPQLALRAVDFGPGYGVLPQTRCPACGKWLTYPDEEEAATIYEDCADHSELESGPYWRPSA